MAYFYHFCVSRQPSPGVVAYNDGTLSRDAAIDDNESYLATKAAIAEAVGFPEAGMTVLSLTLLKAQQ